jgi:glycosyltransferase involved in cell wall biosynthesis
MIKSQMLMQQLFGSRSVIGVHEAVSQPVVSIIIPTFNCLVFLPTAIKSIQAQQTTALEILILDDGSTDETWYYLQLAAECDERIKPIKHKGKGVAKARNHGITVAKGNYIAFLDADDYWFARKLSTQLTFHQENPNVTLSFTNYLMYSDREPDLGDCFGFWPGFTRMLLREPKIEGYRLLKDNAAGTIYAENVIGTSSVMLNRTALGDDLFFDEKLQSAEDWDYWIKASLRGPIGFTTYVDMAYLMRAGSETSQVHLRLKFMRTIMWRYIKPVLRGKPTAMFTSLSRLFTGYGEYHRAAGSTFKSCLYHSMAFTLSPSMRSFKAMLADIKALVWRW